MDWKGKINTLVLIFLIGMIAVSAVTFVVKTESEAIAKYGQAVKLERKDCVVLTIRKPTLEQSEVTSKPIDVTYRQDFTVNGKSDSRTGTYKVASNSQTLMESQTPPKCLELWASIQAEPQFENVDVDIEYENGILNRAYD